jgi:uncharacterized protein YdeI (YjbR/CyaY-like superfamily)
VETNKGIETFYAKTRKQWRRWLEKYGQTKTEVCLIIYHKKSEVQSIDLNEAVEEALCFGWIDSRANKRDNESVYQRFSPRKPAGNWSERNKERVKRLIKGGLMTEHGQKMIDIAKKNGKWAGKAV